MLYSKWKNAEWSDSWGVYFSPKEFAEKSDGWQSGLSPILVCANFMDKFTRLRIACGFPFLMSSGYRSPEYNNAVSSSGFNGPHTTGRAGDIRAHGERALRIVEKATEFGFTGVGIKQSGPISSRFIHLDDLLDSETSGPRPWLWSY